MSKRLEKSFVELSDAKQFLRILDERSNAGASLSKDFLFEDALPFNGRKPVGFRRHAETVRDSASIGTSFQAVLHAGGSQTILREAPGHIANNLRNRFTVCCRRGCYLHPAPSR